MNDSITREIDERHQINARLGRFCALEGWTPAMGAMLIAGLNPIPGCTEIPERCASLRDPSLPGEARAIRHARAALQEWIESSEEDVELGLVDKVPEQVTPTEFLLWSMEQYASSPDSSKPGWLPYWLSYAGWDSNGDAPRPAPPPLVVRAASLEGFAAVGREVRPAIEEPQPVNAAVVYGPQGIDDARFCLTTAEFATERRVKPESVLKRLSKTGSYFGVRPLKKQNRRLMWPAGKDNLT
jgi:hypothetical protein